MKDEKQKLSIFLENLSAQLREELSNLYLSGRRLASPQKRKTSPAKDRNSAYADQSRFRMMRMVRNMEEYAVLLRGEAFLMEVYDIVGLVAEICEESADLAKYLGLELRFFCAETHHACAINPEHIRQLLYQLLSNAMKYTPKGGYVRVSLRFQRSPNRILLFVEDNGRGIPEEELPTLFKWSWNTHWDRDGAHGVGLGLAICRYIAEGHGGTLSVESKVSRGSRFTLSIPDEAEKTILFRQPGFEERNGGIHPSLLMLSDALPWEAFGIENQL